MVKASPTGIEAQVCADIAERQQKGIAKYGTTVADNPLDLRAWLQHAYEEALDNAIYLKRAIAELDGKPTLGVTRECPTTSEDSHGSSIRLDPARR